MKIGIDIGGSHISIAVINNKGNIVEKEEKRITENEKQDIKFFLEKYIIDNVKKYKEKYKIEKMGISIPGTVRNNIILKAVNLNIQDYNIIEKLKKYIDIPINIINDAKAAALAEHKYGCLKKYKRNIFLTLGTGIGGSVIINDKLLDTGNLPGCEFGHIIIEKDGLLCNCGKFGCWEKYGSMKNFKNKLKKELNLPQSTRGEELLNIIRINQNKKDKNAVIEKTVKEYIENLAIGIANLINIFEPEAIGIGGSFVYFQDVLLNKLKQELLEPGTLFNIRNEINIEIATLGNDAGIIGSVL